MKQLYWKEWRETRWLPLIAAALTFVLNGVCAYVIYRVHLATTVGKIDSHATMPQNTSIAGTLAMLFIVWVISGALAGAGSVASEVGNGTVKFLFSLPVRRETIWRVKVLTAVGTLIAALALSSLCWSLMDAVFFGTRFLDAATMMGLHYAPTVLEASFLAFAFAFAASAFVDRTVSALLSAIITGPIFYVVLLATENWSLEHLFPSLKHVASDSIASLLPFLTMAILTAVSYAVFVHGGSLTTALRFKIGAMTGGAALLAATAILVVTTPLLAHFR